MKSETLQLRLVGPTLLVGVLSAAVLMLFLLTLSGRADMEAQAREERLVANGVAGRIAEIEHAVTPQTVWDDAVAHLDNAFDPAWARANIGQFLWQTGGFAATFVLDAAAQPRFAMIDGAEASASAAFAPFAAQAAGLIADVRAAEAGRAPLRPAGGAMVAAPIQSSAVAVVGGRFFVLTATLVQPDFGSRLPKGATAPIVLTGAELGGDFLRAFERRFLLRNLGLHAGAFDAGPGEAHVALRARGGEVLATLAWAPEHPGAAMLRQAIVPIMLVVIGLVAISYLLFRGSRRMAHSLIVSEARAMHLAQHDALTGLPNRLHFTERLSHALERARRTGGEIAVLCLDLDRFKEVNDTLGHHCGDELIREAARRLAMTCRASDSLARLGGDEFAIVQTDATAHSAAILARRVVETLSGAVELPAGRAFLSCSVGVTLVASAEADATEAMRQADLALYRAKERGRAQFCFFEVEMDAALRARRVLEQDLRDALANGDLELAYQPQVNARGVVTGLEALARWTHPRRGPISPSVFVPVAEECGLIEQLGMFAMRRAFLDSRRWPNLRMSINISAHQLRMRDFIERVAELVRETSIDPMRIELEITEGVLLGDDPETHAALQRLRQMGFSLALDDFGTGYSSLSYLRRFPVNKIKIDRSFVASLGLDSEADAVVAAIVKLARALNLGIIAEGVETNAQRKRLMSAGCDEFQGFLTGRPATAAEIDALNAAVCEAVPAA
ncbi:MAG: EAL domain-containing protein [Hyphomonadaceae bacterium]|nr:EAL domain-containing protein [Hyphomonadaceae bacterium]